MDRLIVIRHNAFLKMFIILKKFAGHDGQVVDILCQAVLETNDTFVDLWVNMETSPLTIANNTARLTNVAILFAIRVGPHHF